MSDARLRRRLPTLLAEAVSIVFAVLFALWVDQWWEDRENVRLAERTTEAIAREIEGNRAELLAEGSDDPEEMLAGLDEAIAAFRAGEEPEGVGVNWNVALLSSSAWETAQMTRATQYMELDRLIDLAQVYELQRVFSRMQDDLVSLISAGQARLEKEPVAALLEFRSRYQAARSVRRTLSTIYACTLVEMKGADAVEAGACPETQKPPPG